MVAIIYKNGEEINRIVADENFAKTYCEENGYTYEMSTEPDPPFPPEPDPTYSAEDLLKVLIGGQTDV